jgi:hypothetical protein
VAGYEEGYWVFEIGENMMDKLFNEDIKRVNEAVEIGKDDNKVLIAYSAKASPLETIKAWMIAHYSFMPERVIIPCICEKDFEIVGMTVNEIEQPFIKDEMPASMFSEENFCSQMKMSSCPRFARITVTARNIGSTEKTFTIAIAGPKIKDSEIEREVEKGN